jgi:hypothetical protein
MLLKWTKKLSSRPLCVKPEVCTDDYMVNDAVISDDASRVVPGTYYQNYLSTSRKRVDGRYGLYVFSTAGSGTLLFSHEYNGDKGMGKASPFKPKRGLLASATMGLL